MEPWVWIGQRYWAVSVRVTPGGGALSAERSPFLAISWSRTTGPARIESNSVAASGSPAPGDHVACSVRAARTASHSRSATTARKLCMRTTRAPMDPIDVVAGRRAPRRGDAVRLDARGPRRPRPGDRQEGRSLGAERAAAGGHPHADG